MRFILLLAATTLITLASCQGGASKDAQAGTSQAGTITEPVDSSKFTTIEWIDSTRDYGKINEGQKLDVSFRFKNTGDKPLIIRSVRPGCGCTAAEPPKEPIAPGAAGGVRKIGPASAE